MNTRDKAMQLLGAIRSIEFPLKWDDRNRAENTAYYDLIDSIVEQYKSLLKELYPDFED